MLKRSPPNSIQKEGPGSHTNGNLDGSAEADLDGDEMQRRQIMTGDGMMRESTEETPLLTKHTSESRHPDWIRGEQDIEGQIPRRSPSWPKLHNVVQWPREKGVPALRTLVSPKTWDRKAMFQHVVAEPASCLPAVILGLLLNVLDALSYGRSCHPRLLAKAPFSFMCIVLKSTIPCNHIYCAPLYPQRRILIFPSIRHDSLSTWSAYL